MDLSKQVDLLNSINILSIKPRFLRNFIRFSNSNLSNLPKTLLMAYILSFKKNISLRTNPISLKLSTINFLFLLFLSKFLIYFYLIIKPKITQNINSTLQSKIKILY
jgi:hypothetical protein